jgi:mycothiol synthase
MERPRAASPAPGWPPGVTIRTYDGSEPMLVDWNDAYNDSFAEHWRFVPGELENTRAITKAPGFRPDGLVLAYRDGRCVGYCRNDVHESRGEVSLIGTVKAARGIGLGRALLRWGVDWVERHTAKPVTLMVDGENENALRLYRSEGFDVVNTRRVWSRDFAGA